MRVALWEKRADFTMSLAYFTSKIDIKRYLLYNLYHKITPAFILPSNSFTISLFARFLVIYLLLASTLPSMIRYCRLEKYCSRHSVTGNKRLSAPSVIRLTFVRLKQILCAQKTNGGKKTL